MTDMDNYHSFRFSIYLINHSIISHSNPVIPLGTLKFTVLPWVWMFHEQFNGRDDSRDLLWVNIPQIFFR